MNLIKALGVEHSLASLIDDLTGDDFDMQGLAQFQTLLKGA